MRLGAKRRICIRSNRVNKKKLSVGLVFLLIFVLLFGCTAYFVKIIRPVMMELAKTRATVLAELAIHRAVGNRRPHQHERERADQILRRL